MAGDKPVTKWTEDEKLRFIATLLFHNCATPSMKGMQLPEGRTQKACIHVMQKFKSEYYNGEGAVANATASDGDNELCVSPAKNGSKTNSPKKRKAAGAIGADKAAKKVKVVKEKEDTGLLLGEEAV